MLGVKRVWMGREPSYERMVLKEWEGCVNPGVGWRRQKGRSGRGPSPVERSSHRCQPFYFPFSFFCCWQDPRFGILRSVTPAKIALHVGACPVPLPRVRFGSTFAPNE